MSATGDGPTPGGESTTMSAPDLGAATARSDAELLATHRGEPSPAHGAPNEAPRIGRFYVLDKLGEGGMGQVFAAFDRELDRPVAIKLLLADGDASEGHARLLREAQALARLSHPNVVQIFEVGVAGDQVFVAMELVRGPDLRKSLAAGRRPWREVVALFAAAGRGLAAAHDAGLVHRDFKPANVIVGDDGRVRVLDFGLARAFSAPATAPPNALAFDARSSTLADDLTRVGSIVGTPLYMAPEVFEGVRADARSDQYSFCVALFEALHGIRPFRADTMAALITAKLAGRVSDVPPGGEVPAWLHRIVVRGLSVRPDERWPTMSTLLDELARDPAARLRRGLLATLAATAMILAVVAGFRALAAVAEARREGERAAEAERAAADAEERAERSAYQREVMALAEQSGEVRRLAATPGRERDALVLGVQVLAPFWPDFAAAPRVAIDGLAVALATPIATRTLAGQGAEIRRVAFAPDGATLATVDVSGELRVWDPRNGDVLRTFQVGSGARAIAYNNDGSRLFTCGESSALWDPATGHRIAELSLQQYECPEFGFSSDGSRLVAVEQIGDDRPAQIVVRDAHRGERLWSAAVPEITTAVAQHPDGQRLLVGRKDGAIEVRDLASGELLRVLHTPSAARGSTPLPIAALAISHDGKTLLAHAGAALRVWDLERAEPLRAIGLAPELYTLTLSPDDLRVTANPVMGWTPTRTFDLATGEVVAVIPASDRPSSIHHIGAGRVRVTTHQDGSIRVSEEPAGALVTRVEAHEGNIVAASLAPDGRTLATAGGGGTAKIWDLRDPRVSAHWAPTPGENVVHVEGDLVATLDKDKTLGLYTAGARSPTVRLVGMREVRLLRWKLGRGALWTWEIDADIPTGGELALWDEITGQKLFTSELGQWVDRVHFTPDAAAAAPIVALDDHAGGVEVRDVRANRRLCAIAGEGSRHVGVALSDDGESLAAVDSAGNISIWDTHACNLRAFLGQPDGPRFAVTWPMRQPNLLFSADGTVLVVRAQRELQIFDVWTRERRVITSPCLVSDQPELTLVSADGARVAATCGGRSATWLWDGRSGEQIGLLAGSKALSFTEDAVLLARTSDGWALWDGWTGAALARVPGDIRGIRLSFAWLDASGEHLRARGVDGNLYTLAVAPKGLFAAACHTLATGELAGEVGSACTRALAGR